MNGNARNPYIRIKRRWKSWIKRNGIRWWL